MGAQGRRGFGAAGAVAAMARRGGARGAGRARGRGAVAVAAAVVAAAAVAAAVTMGVALGQTVDCETLSAGDCKANNECGPLRLPPI